MRKRFPIPRFKSIRNRLLLYFILVGLLQLIIVTNGLIYYIEKKIETDILGNLMTIVNEKRDNIEYSAYKIKENVSMMSQTPIIIDALKHFNNLSNPPPQAKDYQRLLTFLEHYKDISNAYNLLLISPQGNVVFSIAQESDMGTNLLTGPYQASGLANAFRKASDLSVTYISSLAYYPPSNQVASFIATPVFEENQFVGVAVAQISAATFEKFSSDYSGLGESGEIVLAKKHENTALFVTATRYDSQAAFQRHVVLSSPDGYPIQQAIQGYRGSGFSVDYNHHDILAAWRYLPSFRLGMVVKIQRSEAFALIKQLKLWAINIGIATLLSLSLIALWVAKSFSKPIIRLNAATQQVANGDLGHMVQIDSLDELGQLSHAFNQMLTTMQQTRDIASMIAAGDYKAPIVPLSDQDELGHALLEMTHTLQGVEHIINLVANGDYTQTATPKSSHDDLARSLNRMIHTLHTSHLITSQDDWLKTGQNDLNNDIRNHLTESELGHHIINFLAHYLEAQIATLYIPEVDELKCIGHYACVKRLQHRVKMGEGLLGQVAIDKKQLIIENVPSHYSYIKSGIGQSFPNYLVIHPVLYGDQLCGLIELGLFQAPTELMIEFLHSVSESIAINLTSLRAHLKLEVLLEETQDKTYLLEKQKQQIETNHQAIEEKAHELSLANQYKSEFLANMSHELRTPLNSILLLSQNLVENKDQNLVDKQIESLHVIHSSGSDLLMLINDILDLSKIEAGQMDIYINEVPIANLAHNLEFKFKHLIADKNLQLNIDIKTTISGVIYTDQKRLEQILKNLVANAIKFTTAGHIDITFSDSELRNEPAIAIAVIDTGIGIPPDQQQLIFEAFKQVDTGSTRRYQGTGLGLSISKEFASLLKGELQLSSQVDHGSTFTLYLPVQSGLATTITPPLNHNLSIPKLKPKNNQLSPSLELRQKKVLLVDDDLRNLFSLSQILEEQEMEVFNANTGVVALSQLQAHPETDIVVMDIMMPEMDGYEAIKTIRSHSQYTHLPIIALTAKAMPADKAHCLAVGANAHLAKPVNTEELLNEIKKLLKSI